MQEYVKIKTDKTTTDLLEQVSDAIEYAILESGNNSEIKENLETVIQNQKAFPNFIDRLKDQLVQINTTVEKVSENNLSQINSNNEVNRKIIIEEIIGLFEKVNKQDKILSNIHLLQKEIDENFKPIAQIKERIKLNHDDLFESLSKAIGIGDDSSQTLDKIWKELTNIKEEVKRDSDEIKSSISLILNMQNALKEKIDTIETNQNKPWYKKL